MKTRKWYGRVFIFDERTNSGRMKIRPILPGALSTICCMIYTFRRGRTTMLREQLEEITREAAKMAIAAFGEADGGRANSGERIVAAGYMAATLVDHALRKFEIAQALTGRSDEKPQ
jgi:hypothetical protein